jgi:type IV pilus assembly protein PilA
LPAPEKIVNQRVKKVTVDRGAIHIEFGNQAHRALQGKVLTVRAAGVDDARIVPVTWLCAGAATPDKMTVQGQDRTTVPRGLLPVRCR